MLSVIKKHNVILSPDATVGAKDLARMRASHIRAGFLAESTQHRPMVIGLVLWLGMMVVLVVPVVANAQACPPGQASCAGSCVTPNSLQGGSCGGSGGRVGTIDECGACTNLDCPGGQSFCVGACRGNAPACPMGSNRTYTTCDGCGGCSSGSTDCDAGAGFNCQATTSSTCPSPRVYDPCTGTCGDLYVTVNPAGSQTGFFNITGNGTIGGDLFLSSGRAIRIDGDTATNLNVGNYSGAAGAGDTFGLRLHAPDTAIAELLLEQGASDRWSISLRTPSRNLEIWRNNGGWANALTVNYGTGAVRLSGQLNAPEFCLAGECRTTWPAVGTVYTAGDYVTIGADNRISATHTGTCFGPIYRANTVPTYDGAQGGYVTANALCGAGRHICTAEEMLTSVRCATVASPVRTTPAGTQAWILAGPPGFTADANDCNGLTANAIGEIGRAWIFGAEGGRGDGLTCNALRAFACCG